MKKVIIFYFISVLICLSVQAEEQTVDMEELARITNNVFAAQNQLKRYANSVKNINTSSVPSEYYTIESQKKAIESSLTKDEFETTVMFRKRQEEAQKRIDDLTKKQNKILDDYNRRKDEIQQQKKNYERGTSWDTITGNYVASELTVTYSVKSIQYDADSGVFDIVVSPMNDSVTQTITEDFSLLSTIPSKSISFKKTIPNIEEAKKYKRNLKYVFLTYSNCPVRISHYKKCIKPAQEKVKRKDWKKSAGETALAIGLGLLFGGVDESAYEDREMPETYWEPAVYHEYLEYAFDTEKSLSFTISDESSVSTTNAKASSMNKLFSLINKNQERIQEKQEKQNKTRDTPKDSERKVQVLSALSLLKNEKDIPMGKCVFFAVGPKKGLVFVKWDEKNSNFCCIPTDSDEDSFPFVLLSTPSEAAKSNIPKENIVFYEDPNDFSDGIFVVFGDDSVKFLEGNFDNHVDALDSAANTFGLSDKTAARLIKTATFIDSLFDD